MSESRKPYMAFMLRLWQVRDGGQVGWRASLENAHTGNRQGFASLGELFAFVRRKTGWTCDADNQDGARQTSTSDAVTPGAQ